MTNYNEKTNQMGHSARAAHIIVVEGAYTIYIVLRVNYIDSSIQAIAAFQ